MPDDRRLIDRLKHRDREVLRIVHMTYKDALLTLAFSMVHEMNAAEDILHDVLAGFAGTFEVKNLPAGRYVFGHAFASLERTWTLAEVTLGPQEHATIAIDADRADAGPAAEGYLVVIVVTQDGVLLATPSVWLERAGRVIVPHFNTDDHKSFSGDPGPCVLHAEYPGYRPVQTTVEIKSKRGRTTQEILAPLVITMTRQ